MLETSLLTKRYGVDFEKEGYLLISTKYKNAKSRLKIRDN
jgi:hypothetical protein